MDGDGGGETIQGELPADDPWHQRYAASSPQDTDGGAHPQNLFRLIRRQTAPNPHQQVDFNIQRVNASASANRNASNGVLLLSRYLDGDDLYYAGVRVDGLAVVKKKVRGLYYTLGSARVFAGQYDRQSSPNLIPANRWVALACDVRTNRDGTVDRRPPDPKWRHAGHPHRFPGRAISRLRTRRSGAMSFLSEGLP